MISILPYGDHALLVNFAQKIDRQIHQQILRLQYAMKDTRGIRFMIPAYCSLTVSYDPEILSATSLQELINASMAALSSTKTSLPEITTETSGRLHEIPVCYAPEYALDLAELSVELGKSPDEIIEAHLSTEFYVYMLGFMPGFAYMGDMPEEFSCNRKGTPRISVPAKSVALAGRQTGIYPFESPGGWQIIGRTTMTLFDPAKDPPSVFAPGDRVRFKRV